MRSGNLYVVTVEFAIDPQRADEFLPLMLDNARRSREAKPGCRQFDVAASAARATDFVDPQPQA